VALKLITAPSVEPIILEETKSYMRLDSSDDDPLIDMLIISARQKAEIRTRRAFITQTWDYILDSVGSTIEIPKPPLSAIGGIFVTGDDGLENTVNSSSYVADVNSEPGRVQLVLGETWPVHRRCNGFRIRFTAGYGNNTQIPPQIKIALMNMVAYAYENRGSPEVPREAEAILEGYRVMRL
jgi:uncharacterized phiE125 gp8 family phage protein